MSTNAGASGNKDMYGYGAPDGDDEIAFHVDKQASYKNTCSWAMSGSGVGNAIGFKFKFDIYIDSASVVGSSARLYQVHFASSTPYILTIELSSDKSGFVLKDMANSSVAGNVTTLTNTISFDTWHTIELVVDLEDFGAMAYVDGATTGVVSENYGRANDGDPVRTELDRIILYAQKASASNTYFDNFELTAQVKFS